MSQDLISQVENLLPQTQCGECEFSGCRPYAEAIVNEQVEINRCPPGGVEVLHKLAKLLHRDPRPFEAEVRLKTRAPATAIIREAECIGCTKCIQACPVDAIIGSGKLLHTVLSDECTGCGLCIEPCPVDCIDLKPLEQPAYNPILAKHRYEARQQRLAAQSQEHQAKHQQAQQSRQAYLQALLGKPQGEDQ